MAEYMTEMVYSSKRINPERIAEGDHKGFHYYVISQGTHPCAYIDVTKTNLNGIDYNLIDLKCHCGLTYSRNYLVPVDNEGWFIGWDYAHYCDFAGYEMELPEERRTNGKVWTTEEIVLECKEAIDELVKLLEVGVDNG